MGEHEPGLIVLSDPLSRPIHFLLLELAVLACTLLVLGHAVHAYRSGDRRALFQWILLTSYGVQMELIAFAFLQNYEHAQFTVQLYDGQLPLYVTGLYGTFMYTGIKVAERLQVHPIAECLLAGLAMCMIDVPFDIAGVAVGWWRWLDGDPNLAFRWLGVPVTSYYWYLVFGAVACGLGRVLWPRVAARPFGVATVVAVVGGFFVIVLGVLGFLPFHAVKALGVADGTIVAAHVAGCVVLAFAAGGSGRARLHPAIATVAVLLPAAHVVLMIVLAAGGRLPDAAERIGYSVAALSGLALMSTLLPLRLVPRRESARLSPAPATARAR